MPLQIAKKNEFIYMAEQVELAGKIFWDNTAEDNYDKLKASYERVLSKALAEGREAVAVPFPKGAYGLLKQEVKVITVQIVRSFLETCEDALLVVLVDFDGEAGITAGWFPELERRLEKRKGRPEAPKLSANCCCFNAYLDQSDRNSEAFVDEEESCYEESPEQICCLKKESRLKERELEDLLKHKPLTFSQLLLKMLDERAITEVEFYKRANMDRKLFSKMRNPSYQPSRNTVLAAVVGLRLSVEEAKQLMASAGYGWNRSNDTDIIVMHFLNNRIFDIDRLNLTLYDHGEKTLGTRIS